MGVFSVIVKPSRTFVCSSTPRPRPPTRARTAACPAPTPPRRCPGRRWRWWCWSRGWTTPPCSAPPPTLQVSRAMVWYGMVWYGMVWYGMVWRWWCWSRDRTTPPCSAPPRTHQVSRDGNQPSPSFHNHGKGSFSLLIAHTARSIHGESNLMKMKPGCWSQFDQV